MSESQESGTPSQDEQAGQGQERREEEEHKQRAFENIRIGLNSGWSYVRSVLSLKDGLDREGTVEGIKQDVEFRGHAAWILVCSILIASIGLGENNIPVIVGAMLISPLMGPILGIGLAAGTNDFELLKRSLTNFGIAITISLIISTIYFLINPVITITAELESRKQAVLTAIAIALLGGAAGIIAGSRSFKSNVVPGVAIATALMPPLCTAGYGLASLQWDYFFGALYLFFINSVFIAVPTYFYIRYMNFPVKEFVDPARERKIKRNIAIFILIIVIPSGIGFYRVLTKSFFQRNATEYLADLERSLEGTATTIVNQNIIYTDTLKAIKVALMGQQIDDATIIQWQNRMEEFDLTGCALRIVQDEDITEAIMAVEERTMEQSRILLENLIMAKDEEIEKLRGQLRNYSVREIDMVSVSKEVHTLFPDLEKAAYAENVETEFDGRLDTIPTVLVSWNQRISPRETQQKELQLSRWLQVRLNKDTVRIVSLYE